MKELNKKILVIEGVTSSGKSALAVKLAGLLDAEIISADSRQVYKEPDIAVAKPSAVELNSVKHHLIGIESIVGEEYTAGRFLKDAKAAAEDIFARGKNAIIAGGTGFYIKSFFQGDDLPRVEPNPSLRKELEKLSNVELHKLLEELDEEAAREIHPNNTPRLVRAIEVIKSLKTTRKAAMKPKNPSYRPIYVLLDAESREFLYDRINKRVHLMLEAGLLDEAKMLLEQYSENNIILNTIGYKEFVEYFAGEKPLEECVLKLQQHTRNYAKRQLTWLRAQQNRHKFFIDKLSEKEIIDEILKVFQET